MEYVNRRGDRYFVFRGRTKTGKPKYFASKKESSDKGELIESLPDGFEIFEHPRNSTVFIRRCKKSRVIEAERELVERLVLELSAHSLVRTIIDGDQIVVYTPHADPMAAAERMAEIFGVTIARAAEQIATHTDFAADLRFSLVDADARSYFAERFCYRGSVDDWIPVGGPAPLETLVRRFVPHLGQESFYDL
ncbi:MAG: hypothetical protein ABI614_19360 [Planctomycetota bacterium]